jgi:DNA modification methylase
VAELTWEGKYDEHGRRRAPVRVSLPFQTVETVNESAQERQRSLDLFSAGHDPEWRNRLIWGDKKYVLPSLLDEFAGKVDLIYIDPPFATGQDFSFPIEIAGQDFVKEPSMIEVKAYRDTWGEGIDSYAAWFYDAATLLRELLNDKGSLWVHLDWRIAYHAKCILDELFGPEGFRNDVISSYGGSGRGAKAIASQFPRNHDILLWYSKSALTNYRPQYVARRVPLADAGKAGYRLDENGRWFKTAPRGDYTDDSLAALEQQGRIHRTKTGSVRIKYFLRQEAGYVIEDVMLGDTWSDVPDAMHLPESEKTGYATQKPQALLERIMRTGVGDASIVLDCFCGSGTTAVAAETLGRRWIAADLGRFAIHTTRKRLLSIPNVKPFVVQNLGKYERQAWQGVEFGDQPELRYRSFILDLYKARPISGYNWLHGLKSGHMVHVGSVDAPISSGDVQQIALEFKRSMGTGADAPSSNRVDVLGWDFAFELNEVARQQAALANIDFHFVRIPREVLEKRAVEQGDISFFELAALAVDVKQRGLDVTLELTDFTIPLDDVPEEIQRAITHWSQWIDYWAVDWDNKGDTFHNEWQTYRTRKDPTLQRSVCRRYEDAGRYRIVVKVIDILGNDTTKTLEVEVA